MRSFTGALALTIGIGLFGRLLIFVILMHVPVPVDTTGIVGDLWTLLCAAGFTISAVLHRK